MGKTQSGFCGLGRSPAWGSLEGGLSPELPFCHLPEKRLRCGGRWTRPFCFFLVPRFSNPSVTSSHCHISLPFLKEIWWKFISISVHISPPPKKNYTFKNAFSHNMHIFAEPSVICHSFLYVLFTDWAFLCVLPDGDLICKQFIKMNGVVGCLSVYHLPVFHLSSNYLRDHPYCHLIWTQKGSSASSHSPLTFSTSLPPILSPPGFYPTRNTLKKWG